MNNVNTKNDTISRRAAIDAADRADYTGLAVEDVKKVTDEVIKELKQLPSAQPQRMRAKWIATTSLQEGQITWRDYKCSNCSHHRRKPMNFCEVCGAKMER